MARTKSKPKPSELSWEPLEPQVCLIYGESGTGKTHFAATWPRPVLLCDAVERGGTTVQWMDPDWWWEAGWEPKVIPVHDYIEVREEIDKIEAAREDDPNCVLTVVIDSLTFYSENLVDYLKANEGLDPDHERNKFKLWQRVKDNIMDLRSRLHQSGLNVVWTALRSAEEGSQGEPMVVGKARKKLPAACDLVCYADTKRNAEGEIAYNIYTKPYRGNFARSRYGDALSEPLEAPSYTTIYNELMCAQKARMEKIRNR